MRFLRFLPLVIWIALSSLGTAGSAASDVLVSSYRDSILSWRQDREERLRSENGWLTIAGLCWLEPGANRFGTDPENQIVFPEGSAPAQAGSIVLEQRGDGSVIRLVAEENVEIACNDTLVSERVLRPDDPGPADVLSLGRIKFWILKRADRWAVRLRDPEHPLRREFTGIDFYPVNEDYRIGAKFEFLQPPETLLVPNMAGYVDTMQAFGRVFFELADSTHSLTPMTDSPADSNLFIVMSDKTTGVETYGGGRFLTARLEPGGRVILDFNKAYNPPCAFNPYTTCPLPPEGNALPVAIRAGEKRYIGSGQ
jgi:uncharacterized protein (DUF1684 family)